MRAILEERALSSQCISYMDLASVLGVTTAPIIATITDSLEELMQEDAALNRPILAALVVQKGRQQMGQHNLPRPGFFEKLHDLNIIGVNEQMFDKESWHLNELNELKIFYTK